MQGIFHPPGGGNLLLQTARRFGLPAGPPNGCSNGARSKRQNRQKRCEASPSAVAAAVARQKRRARKIRYPPVLTRITDYGDSETDNPSSARNTSLGLSIGRVPVLPKVRGPPSARVAARPGKPELRERCDTCSERRTTCVVAPAVASRTVYLTLLRLAARKSETTIRERARWLCLNGESQWPC
jgi:hypothetical protein